MNILHNYKLLLATRHMKRKDGTEYIADEDIALAPKLRSDIDLIYQDFRSIEKDFKTNDTAVTSGYKSKNMDGRTENTAKLFGFDKFIINNILSYSPGEGWEKIPFGKDSSEYEKAIKNADPATCDMAATHGIEYLKIMKEHDKDVTHIFTHEGRIEAACMIIMPKWISAIGGAIDYGETLAAVTMDYHSFEPIAIFRRDGIEHISKFHDYYGY